MSYFETFIDNYWPGDLETVDTSPSDIKSPLEQKILKDRSPNSTHPKRHNLLPYLQEINNLGAHWEHHYYGLFLRSLLSYVQMNPGNYVGMLEHMNDYIVTHWTYWMTVYSNQHSSAPTNSSVEIIRQGLQLQVQPFIKIYVDPLVKVDVIGEADYTAIRWDLDVRMTKAVTLFKRELDQCFP
uniref:Orf182 n=1 Tax=Hyaloraphidium curvatum TaxID=82268 RepID=Q950U9_HYACU|nr:orf182 [Hyaloraphidium curvatum]AAK83417.1 orf182 [Hyaloraphidium curvatum]